MNLREGTRRLALLVGGLGAIAGLVASYSYLQPVMRQRQLHTAFEQLANSDVVRQEREKLQAAPDFIPANPDSIPAPPVEYDAQGKPIPTPAPAHEYDANGKPIPQHGRIKEYTAADLAPSSGTEVDWSTAVPLWSDVSKGGIKTINWGHDYAVASIETANGETLSPTPAPRAREYLLAVLFPFIGFLIPWGVIRAIGWMLAGFVAPST